MRERGSRGCAAQRRRVSALTRSVAACIQGRRRCEGAAVICEWPTSGGGERAQRRAGNVQGCEGGGCVTSCHVGVKDAAAGSVEREHWPHSISGHSLSPLFVLISATVSSPPTPHPTRRRHDAGRCQHGPHPYHHHEHHHEHDDDLAPTRTRTRTIARAALADLAECPQSD